MMGWFVGLGAIALTAIFASNTARAQSDPLTAHRLLERSAFPIHFNGPAHYAPSGKRFAVVPETEQAGGNAIEVWSTADNWPRAEWIYQLPDGEYAVYHFVGWDGDERLKMTVTTKLGEKLYEDLPVEAIRTDEGWKLMPPVLTGNVNRPKFVTLDPEKPSMAAWYLRAIYHPFGKAVRGIPVARINKTWCEANELTKELIPSELLVENGVDTMAVSGLSFAVEGHFDGSKVKQIALVGVYRHCDGKTGYFLLILDPPRNGTRKIRFLEEMPRAEFLALQAKADSIVVWFCMDCDGSSGLQWDKSKHRFDWAKGEEN